MEWLVAAAWLNILSGALMAGLGILLVAANPRKDWNRLFAILSVFWGAQIVAANLVRLLPTANAARLAGEIGLAFLLPLAFFVAAFAAVFPTPRLARAMLPVIALVAPSLVALGLLFLDTSALVEGIGRDAQGHYTMQWGPAFAPLVVAPLYAAFFYAVFALMRRHQETEAPLVRKQIAFVLAAFAIFLAYNVPVQLYLFGAGARSADVGAWIIATTMLAGAALLLALAARLWKLRADPDARGVLAALAASGALGLASAGWIAAGGERIDLLGLVRIASVGLVVYAIARYQLFDTDLRLKSAATALAALLATLALGAAAWIALRGIALTAALQGILVGAAALVAFVPMLRVAGRVADRLVPQVSREGDHLFLRKLEVYRAAVETRADDAALAELRAKLGLSQRDHDLVVNMALARAETSTPAPDLRPGGVVFGKYAIDSILAEGGYGRIFLARDKILQRPVVIKELQARWRGNATVVKTFLREAQIAGRLNHPNIVNVLEVERHGEDHYIIMEHMAGGSLEERLHHGALPEAEAHRVARAVLAALDAAHAQGVIHRDVKPGNILLGARGEVKLTDFGIAQMSADDPQRTISGLTSGALAAAGTLPYMSPEQARGNPLDARSDLYAVGALLHRMILGKPHLDLAGLDEYSARAAVAEARAPPPPPGPLGGAIAKALAPDPADRWQTARAFAAALGEAPVARGV